MDVFDVLTPIAAAQLRASVLAPLAQACWDRLTELRYSPHTARRYLNCLAHFAQWSRRWRFDLCRLDQHISDFVDRHLPCCRCPTPAQRSRNQVRAALEVLKVVVYASGVRSDDRRGDPVEVQLQRFDRHLHDLKGLAASTRLRRVAIVRALLSMTENAVTPAANELRQFLVQELSRVSVASAGVTTSAVRSYLRFLAFEGERIEHLLPVVTRPACWRLASLPQALTTDEIKQLLGAFPAGLRSRLRCYALVRCVVDLGLRSGEVIDLELDDIDWGAGVVRICKGKSRRVDVLPLPHATGAAIADYVRWERPSSASRRIFVRHVAPVDKPVTTGVVRRAVCEAYRRAGLPVSNGLKPRFFADERGFATTGVDPVG